MTSPSPVTLSLALAASLLAAGCSKQAPQQATTTSPQVTQPAPITPAAPAQQAVDPNAAATAQQQAPQQQAMGGYPATAQGTGANTPVQRQATPRYAPTPSSRREAASPATAASRVPADYTIPVGTHIRVTTREELGSKISQAGQSFSATVADPIVVDGVTLVRSGASATGTVIDAKSLGRFKGQASLGLRLDSIRADGRTYEVETSSIERAEKGKGKRTAVLAGGGGGVGALIGGLAGGGKGALIGGLLGAGGGTAGAAFSGNKEIVIPAETNLTFRLERAVTVGR